MINTCYIATLLPSHTRTTYLPETNLYLLFDLFENITLLSKNTLFIIFVCFVFE